jgi:hypothetical protein
MDRQNKKFHRDFDFTHYYKFVPPISQVIGNWFPWAFMLGILYGILRTVFHSSVAAWLADIFYIFTAATILNYVRYKVAWHKGMVRTSATAGINGRYLRWEIAERRVDVINYLKHKANRNVFICGTSGQGKSFLTRYLLDLVPNQKVIFNFKPGDEYLKMGYPIVEMDKALPNPFTNTEAFLNAFLITFPIANLGITAEQVPIFVRELGKASKNWQEFNDNLQRKLAHTKDKIQQSALMFIANTMKSVVSSQNAVIEIGKDNVVFDFSKLNQDSKTFYAEVILRQLWHELIIEEKRQDILICVDEAHRLLKKFEKYESVYNEMSREIRAYGMLWTSTQNLTDMEEDIRNQFATQFVFNTNKPEDTSALSGTDQMLAWSVTSLELHYFTDARYQWVHEVIPEFYLYFKPKDKPRTSYEGVKQEGKEGAVPEGEKTQAIDYRQEIREILDEHPAYATQMGKIIAEKYGITKDKAKLGVKGAIGKMLANDEFDTMKMKESGVDVLIYYNKSANMSGLHKFMQEAITKTLTDAKIKVLKAAKSGSRSVPDVETESFSVEIETGLKHDHMDLESRILRATKRVIIVVPNDSGQDKYKYLKSDKVDIVTLDGFDELLKGLKK